jgi:hypothetical protein
MRISPIAIDEQPPITESPTAVPRSSPSPSGNLALQQALSHLVKASNSAEISWDSIPLTSPSTNSYKLVVNEIDKQVKSAEDRKAITRYNGEVIISNVPLYDIKSFTLRATDSECSYDPIGPAAGSCEKIGRDFKCRFVELRHEYNRVCVSGFSLQ